MSAKNMARVLLSTWCAVAALSSSTDAASLTRSESPSTPVLLTFDVEDRADDPALRLLQLQTPATYFIGGRFAEDSPGLVRELAENPRNTIGSHAYAHQDLTGFDPVEIRKDILLSKLLLRELIGYAPSWFRAPFLKTDERVGEVLQELGFTHDSSNSERWMTNASEFELPISSDNGILVSDYDLFSKHRMSDAAALAWLVERYQERTTIVGRSFFSCTRGSSSSTLECSEVSYITPPDAGHHLWAPMTT
jgi:peptidoglycan/xylan/chitin deacetylase (PgdA/CDA1 family)